MLEKSPSDTNPMSINKNEDARKPVTNKAAKLGFQLITNKDINGAVARRSTATLSETLLRHGKQLMDTAKRVLDIEDEDSKDERQEYADGLLLAASKKLQRSLKLTQNDEALSVLCLLYNQMGLYKSSYESGMRIAKPAKEVKVLLKELEGKLENLVELLESLEESKERFPGSWMPYIEIGNVYADLRDFDEAKKSFKEALKYGAKAGFVEAKLGEYDFLKGLMLTNTTTMKRNLFNRAKKHFNQALSLGYSKSGIFNFLGAIYVDRGEMQKAIECFKKALNKDTKNLSALSNLFFRYLSEGNLIMAKEYLDKAAAINPFDEITVMNIRTYETVLERLSANGMFVATKPLKQNISSRLEENANDGIPEEDIDKEIMDELVRGSKFNVGSEGVCIKASRLINGAKEALKNGDERASVNNLLMAQEILMDVYKYNLSDWGYWLLYKTWNHLGYYQLCRIFNSQIATLNAQGLVSDEIMEMEFAIDNAQGNLDNYIKNAEDVAERDKNWQSYLNLVGVYRIAKRFKDACVAAKKSYDILKPDLYKEDIAYIEALVSFAYAQSMIDVAKEEPSNKSAVEDCLKEAAPILKELEEIHFTHPDFDRCSDYIKKISQEYSGIA